jgi:AraC family transcriptional regulator
MKERNEFEETQPVAAPNGPTMGEWYATHDTYHFVENRRLGTLPMFEFFQPPGACKKPPMDIFLLHLAIQCDGNCVVDLGDGKVVSGVPSRGAMVLSVPGEPTAYDLPCETHGLALELDATRVGLLAAEIDPRFPGHFGPLHSAMWRDHTIRDTMLGLWRAGRGDDGAPAVDPDSALLALTTRLLRRAGRAGSRAERPLSLAPHVLRRVLDYIEANLDGDCDLFRLAAVAELSPFHFARAFRRDMADPPHRYVVARRLQRAIHLVRTTERDLSEIALACGFAQQSRMADAFTRHLGISPGRLRRSAKEGRPPLYSLAPPIPGAAD